MKQTRQISLGGYAFTIDVDAYACLEEYIAKVRRHSSEDVREELVSDIEERLAELFLERCPKGVVVDESVVRYAVSRIGDPSEDQPGQSSDEAERSSRREASSERRRFYRNMDDRVFAGICSGAAKYFGADVFLIRLCAGLLFLFFLLATRGHGAGEMILLYLIIWMISPSPKTVEQKCRAEGKPLHFNEFKETAENTKVMVEDTAEEMKSAPGFRAFGRAIAVVIGIVFALVGMTTLVFETFSMLNYQFIVDAAHEWALNYTDEAPVMSFMSDAMVMWPFAATVGLFGVSMLYAGVMMIFDLRTPKWRPGLILFLLWVAAVIFFGLCVARHTIEYYSLLRPY